jgi:hypothetical protein
MYAVAALVTGANSYNRAARFLDHNSSMKVALLNGVLWPGYWGMRGTVTLVRRFTSFSL